MSFHQEPLPKAPPTLPIPSDASSSQSHWSILKSTYKLACQFWAIAFEMNYLYHFKKSASLSSAVTIYQKLLAWADMLQADKKRDEHNPDHVLNLQQVQYSIRQKVMRLTCIKKAFGFIPP